MKPRISEISVPDFQTQINYTAQSFPVVYKVTSILLNLTFKNLYNLTSTSSICISYSLVVAIFEPHIALSLEGEKLLCSYMWK